MHHANVNLKSRRNSLRATGSTGAAPKQALSGACACVASQTVRSNRHIFVAAQRGSIAERRVNLAVSS